MSDDLFGDQETGANPESGTSKQGYSSIRVSGAIFILVLIVMLGANFWLSGLVKEDSVKINLAGRQRMLSQKIAKAAAEVNEAAQTRNFTDVSAFQDELEEAHDLFDATLTAFRETDMTLGADGKKITIEASQDPEAVRIISEATEIWQGLSEGLLRIARVSDLSATDPLVVQEIEAGIREQNLTLLDLMNQLTNFYENSAQRKTTILQIVLGAALALEVINFLYIIYYSVGRLKKSDERLTQYSQDLSFRNEDLAKTNEKLAVTQKELSNSNESLQEAFDTLQQYSEEVDQKNTDLEMISKDLNRLKEESDTIFNSVHHGLCLLDKDFKIGTRVSSEMYTIFERKNLSGMPFLDLMRPLITEKDLNTLESYLKLQFNGKTSDKQLEKYNPLRRIEITLSWDGKSFAHKHLGFEFERIREEDEIAAVLVSVDDVTDTVVLENELRMASESHERKTTLILELIQAPSNELDSFLSQSERSLDTINDLLKEQGVVDNQAVVGKHQRLVEDVFRRIHNIKGNASMLGLDSIVEISHEVENRLGELRGKEQISGDEFLGSIVKVAELRERLSDFDDLSSSLGRDLPQSARSRASRKADNASEPLSRFDKLEAELAQFVSRIADETGKTAFVRLSADPGLDLSPDGFDAMRDVAVQFARNSVVHGIEPPAEREQAGKMQEGMIAIRASAYDGIHPLIDDTAIELVLRDDGAGLNIENIKRHAIDLGLVTRSDADGLSSSQLAGLIFYPGFSTSEGASEHAGRGSGLDFIKDTVVTKLGGKLSMSYAEGQYMQLTCTIPESRVIAEVSAVAG